MARQVSRIEKEYPEETVKIFLKELVDDLVTRLRTLGDDESYKRLYKVNLLISHDPGGPCPIVIENIPSLQNLLGQIEREVGPTGASHTDHLMIQAGSLLRADGGYLILEVRDVLLEPGAWKVLLRTLRTGELEIVPSELKFFWTGPTLKPEPIKINVKVVLLGDPDLYGMLDAYDPDFPLLFKVLADFDTSIARDDKGIQYYAGILSKIARDEKLMSFSREAVSALVEHGARIAARRGRLTTRFGRLADIAREASFIGNKDGSKVVRETDVHAAVLRTKRRADLPARKFRKLVSDGVIRIQAQGAAVGQINGLAVIHAGPLTYGFPTRITATIGPGTAGAINIEREAQLSGAIHTKGFYILGGLLRHLLRTEHPLAFSSSIAFEQSYGGIDGDSASGAEICCLLSALTEIPLRQDLAITGAIDQLGHIQAIGAVTEKVEGFFDACNEMGLTGTQGVIIPRANAGDLMLRSDVVGACEGGRFHVYAVESIHDALELFTGRKAGHREGAGNYPEGTVLHEAVRKAGEYWALVSGKASRPGDEEEEEEEEGEEEEVT
jgi:predicted ATP-dependent protease